MVYLFPLSFFPPYPRLLFSPNPCSAPQPQTWKVLMRQYILFVNYSVVPFFFFLTLCSDVDYSPYCPVHCLSPPVPLFCLSFSLGVDISISIYVLLVVSSPLSYRPSPVSILPSPSPAPLIMCISIEIRELI
ncbi:uncharacterized protein BO95DRAFT_121852 [Aspergillus brunneoviolaceus CBS 621.78]|uniref:Uncharacterized protein n=1 Tax=Aspergillus brunneoviolaceus CBS 621.78 TaxID=1450534 RepID=A0ACD1G9V2_9EURO|nr:hypothetical protein BO95DRAFT_121852 [Aspergillus brunneoviolaceus CBS 621.78]RAH46029.1 hypothetical protein BO95DRAFT_121852 [Aspergillus brunneoviolaceus CBS 621.78]